MDSSRNLLYVVVQQASQGSTVIDYKDWQIPLGRRFRYETLFSFDVKVQKAKEYVSLIVTPYACILGSKIF